MSKVRIVYRVDGGVTVIHPVDGMDYGYACDKAMHGELEGRPYDDVDGGEVPTDRKYRDAWTGSKGNGISIDAVKKVEIDAKPVYTEEQEAQIHAKMREMAVTELGF